MNTSGSMTIDINKVWVIHSYLVNFLPPLIAEKNDSHKKWKDGLY